MKMIAMIAAAVVLTTSAANAGSWIEKPCASKCRVTRILPPLPPGDYPNGVPDGYRRPTFSNYSNDQADLGDPTYQSRSQTIIRSTYGTSTIRSTYRHYAQ